MFDPYVYITELRLTGFYVITKPFLNGQARDPVVELQTLRMAAENGY